MHQEPQIDDEVTSEEKSPNGNKSTVYRSDAQNAFHHESGLNFLRALIEVGDLGDSKTLPNLAIRATIPSHINEGHVLATAIAACWSNNEQYGNEEGNKELIMLVAAWAGVDAERANLMVKAATSEYQQPNKGGLGDRIQNLAWGNRNKG